MKLVIVCAGFMAFVSANQAFAQGRDIAPRDGASNFDRTHRVIEERMQGGRNDRSPPLGQGPGERTGIGGAHGGGNQPGGPNQGAINQRNQ